MKKKEQMCNENRETGQHDIRILINTIEQVKKYLDEELAKYETWEEVCANKSIITSNKFIRCETLTRICSP